KLKSKVIVQCLSIQPSRDRFVFEDRFYLGGKDQAFAIEVVRERFDANAVADQPTPTTIPVPQSKREHTTELMKRFQAPFFISINDRFSITVAAELVAFRLEQWAHLRVVVNLAVVHQSDRAIAVAHGLIAVVAQVQDA